MVHMEDVEEDRLQFTAVMSKESMDDLEVVLTALDFSVAEFRQTDLVQCEIVLLQSCSPS